MAPFREEKREEKQGQHCEDDGVDEIQQALKEAAIGGEIELAPEFAGVAKVKRVVGEESCVCVGAECGVDNTHPQGERSY